MKVYFTLYIGQFQKLKYNGYKRILIENSYLFEFINLKKHKIEYSVKINLKKI